MPDHSPALSRPLSYPSRDRRDSPAIAPSQECLRICLACGCTQLIEIRQKLHCGNCRSIVETCCEGGRG